MDEEKKDYGMVVETLKSLYVQKKIELRKIREMVGEKKITPEEYEYIIKR